MTKSFILFPSLPPELQAKIWEAAILIDAPQIVEAQVHEQEHEGHGECEASLIDFSDDDDDVGALVTTNPRPRDDCVIRRLLVFPWAASKQRRRPALMDVCRESRRLALMCGALLDLWLDVRHQAPRPVWFRFGVDIVFIPNLDENIYQLQPPLENPHHLARIRHLAVEWAFFHCGRWEPDSDEYRGVWLAKIHLLYKSCPSLTDIYLCLPALRHAQTDYMAEVGVHFEEPPTCERLPIHLAVMAPERALPRCTCRQQPGTWAESERNIDATFSSEWLRIYVHTEFWDKGVGIIFPPRVHGCILLRKCLDLEKVKSQETGHKVEIEEDFFEQENSYVAR